MHVTGHHARAALTAEADVHSAVTNKHRCALVQGFCDLMLLTQSPGAARACLRGPLVTECTHAPNLCTTTAASATVLGTQKPKTPCHVQTFMYARGNLSMSQSRYAKALCTLGLVFSNGLPSALQKVTRLPDRRL